MDMDSKVRELREKFFTVYQGKIEGGAYHKDDIERVRQQDAFLRNVINGGPAGGDVEKAVAVLDEILLFRVENKLNDLMESDMHPALIGAQFYKGRDKQGHKIFHIKPKKVDNPKKLKNERHQLLLFRFFQHYRDNPEHQVVVLMDLAGVGPSDLDPESGKFMMHVLFRYFPCMVEKVMFFKMKPPVQALMKIVKKFQDSKDHTKEVFVKRSNIQEYIDESQLEPHMIKQPKK